MEKRVYSSIDKSIWTGNLYIMILCIPPRYAMAQSTWFLLALVARNHCSLLEISLHSGLQRGDLFCDGVLHIRTVLYDFIISHYWTRWRCSCGTNEASSLERSWTMDLSLNQSIETPLELGEPVQTSSLSLFMAFELKTCVFKRWEV